MSSAPTKTGREHNQKKRQERKIKKGEYNLEKGQEKDKTGRV